MTSGTYYDVIFSKTSNDKIDDIIKELGLTKDFKDAFHCTLVYSKTLCTKLKTSKGTKQAKDKKTGKFSAKNKLSLLCKIKSFGHFDTDEGKNLHIELESDWCQAQHKRALTSGCTSDYPTYKAHVTLMYNCKDFSVNDDLVKEFIGERLEIVEERITPLNLDWVKDSSVN